MKHFEWIVLGEFCETDLIENENWKQIILFPIRVILRLLVSLLNTLRGARIGTLERHHNEFLDCFEVGVD